MRLGTLAVEVSFDINNPGCEDININPKIAEKTGENTPSGVNYIKAKHPLVSTAIGRAKTLKPEHLT